MLPSEKRGLIPRIFRYRDGRQEMIGRAGEETVDIGEFQPAIVERGLDRERQDLERGMARHLAGPCLSEADDRGLAAQGFRPCS